MESRSGRIYVVGALAAIAIAAALGKGWRNVGADATDGLFAVVARLEAQAPIVAKPLDIALPPAACRRLGAAGPGFH